MAFWIKSAINLPRLNFASMHAAHGNPLKHDGRHTVMGATSMMKGILFWAQPASIHDTVQMPAVDSDDIF